VRYAVLDGQLHRNVADAEKLKTENPGVCDNRLLAYEDIVAHAVTGLGHCVSDAVAWVSYARVPVSRPRLLLRFGRGRL
jgi:hypothetical protein